MTDDKTPTTKPKASRMQHVVIHDTERAGPGDWDDVVVFGQEIDALRHIIGKTNWRYVAVPHGQSVAEALKVASS